MQREDAGHYTLFGKAKTGKITRKDIELVVEEKMIEDTSTGDDPPTFVRRLTDLSVKVGTRTRLLVEIRSSSQVKVSLIYNLLSLFCTLANHLLKKIKKKDNIKTSSATKKDIKTDTI